MLNIADYFGELKLRRDSHVVDFGTSVGTNAKILSELIPDGKVFAIDVHKEMLELLDEEIEREKKNAKDPENVKLQNIKTVWADFEQLDGTRLRDESVDAILASNVFYLLQHKKTTIMEMKRILKRYGKILFVDWHTPLGSSTLHKASVLREKDIIDMFTEAGFEVRPRIFKDDYHFVLVIEKK